jgi:hypothetical protein
MAFEGEEEEEELKEVEEAKKKKHQHQILRHSFKTHVVSKSPQKRRRR